MLLNFRLDDPETLETAVTKILNTDVKYNISINILWIVMQKRIIHFTGYNLYFVESVNTSVPQELFKKIYFL